MSQPTVKLMLEVGKECGLNTLNEAYSNLMLHYDAFFIIDEYHTQKSVFNGELIDLGLCEPADNQEWLLNDITIDEALEIVNKGK